MKVSGLTYDFLSVLYHVCVLLAYGLAVGFYAPRIIDHAVENGTAYGPLSVDFSIVVILTILPIGYALWATDAIEPKETDTA